MVLEASSRSTPPPPWLSKLSDLLKCANQYLAASLIHNEALSEQVRVDAMKDLNAAVEKFSTSVNARVGIAA